VDEVCKGFHHLEGTLGVEGGGLLVCQHYGGVVDQGTRDGDALLLSAGELSGQVVEPVAEAQAGEDLRRADAANRVGSVSLEPTGGDNVV
jgi:hypothetical protein